MKPIRSFLPEASGVEPEEAEDVEDEPLVSVVEPELQPMMDSANAARIKKLRCTD